MEYKVNSGNAISPACIDVIEHRGRTALRGSQGDAILPEQGFEVNPAAR